jgi:hypothetical protein
MLILLPEDEGRNSIRNVGTKSRTPRPSTKYCNLNICISWLSYISRKIFAVLKNENCDYALLLRAQHMEKVLTSSEIPPPAYSMRAGVLSGRLKRLGSEAGH